MEMAIREIMDSASVDYSGRLSTAIYQGCFHFDSCSEYGADNTHNFSPYLNILLKRAT